MLSLRKKIGNIFSIRNWLTLVAVLSFVTFLTLPFTVAAKDCRSVISGSICLENLSADDTSLSPGETATITYDITGDVVYQCKIVSGITDAAKPAIGSPEQIDYDELASPGTNTIKVGCRVSGDADGGGGAYDDMTETITITKASGPTAVDDGNTDASICTEINPKDIDVLANDSDNSDSLSELAITDTGSPSKGSTAKIQMNGHDGIRYTPTATENSYDYSFTYTIEDTDGLTDTATVSGTVTNDGCGYVTIKAVDQNGNSQTVDELGFKFEGDKKAKTNAKTFTLSNITLTDTPKEAITGNSYVKDSGFDVSGFDKNTNGPDDYPNDPTRSKLGL